MRASYERPERGSHVRVKQRRRAAKRVRGTGRLLLAVVVVLLFSWAIISTVSNLMPKPSVIDPSSLRQQIVSVMTGYHGVYGVYLKILETGEELRLNDSEYVAASCYKLPLSLLVYESAANGQINLDSKVALRQEDWEAGTGVLQATRMGTEFTIRELVRLSIVQSDNIAANMLLRTVGKDRLVDFYKTVGAKVLPVQRNVSTPSDMGIFLERLVYFAKSKPALGGELLSCFLDSKFKDRLGLKLPESVEVLNKIGTWPGTVNDVGIVISDRVSYVISVMSKEVGPPEIAEKAISDISLVVYNHIAARAANKRLPQNIGKRILALMANP